MFTQEQLFFLSWAEFWCSTSDANMQWRIDEALENYQEFGRAFDCPSGSQMAPDTYCHVWGVE